ncbi:MAG TPA: hypothetical protein VJB60_02765 [Candidatus Peribacterales bacterium]|nr:hypothetical protein [Candidatus Peribacterales bacterium]
MDAQNTSSPEPLPAPTEKEDIEKNKDVAAISYLWILSVIVLYARRDSPFIQYHAKQGLWLFMVSIPIWLIPRIGHYLEFFVLAGMIIGFLNAAQGRMHDLPVIGALAKGTLTLRDLWKKGVAMMLRALDVFLRAITPTKKGEKAPQDQVAKTPLES